MNDEFIQFGETPLITAASNGDAAIVGLLLESIHVMEKIDKANKVIKYICVLWLHAGS